MIEHDFEFASPILGSLGRVHAEVSRNTTGQVASYIPELAKADPTLFGICLVTAQGSIYEVGDTRKSFTIQSISKPFVYGLALEDNSRASVLEKVGVEATGDAFNSISLEPGTGRPRNPMINAGAIAVTGLVDASNPERRASRILETLGTYAGRHLAFDETVYRSERDTGHRNRAIGHLLRNFGILECDPIPVVETYFRQCSVSITCLDLAMMAATLANRGTNPLTGKQALRGEYVENVLSVMETCGMYDSAGRWVYEIGMPAKSGVSGGVIAVLPGQLGIGVFSPPLDPQGNSVRGVQVCRDLSRYLDLHILNRPTTGRLTVRRRLSGADFGSKRVRPEADRKRLSESGGAIQVYQLQGHLDFSTTETLVADILDRGSELRFLVLDFRRVLTINQCACYLLDQLGNGLASRGVATSLAELRKVPALARYLRRKHGSGLQPGIREFPDRDRALEWAENEFLDQPKRGTDPRPNMSSRFDIVRGLDTTQSSFLDGLMRGREFAAGEVLIETGSTAGELFLLETGTVSVVLAPETDAERRIATFEDGMAFGEMALLDDAPRSARVVADTSGSCRILDRSAFRILEKEHPAILLVLLRNIGLSLSARLRKANSELALLD